MALIELGGDYPTEAAVDQSDIANNEGLDMRVHGENVTLTITNPENSDNIVQLEQEIFLNGDSPYTAQLTLAENAQVNLNRITGSSREVSSMNYTLGEGSTLKVSIDITSEIPNANFNVDMGEGASTFIYLYYSRIGVSLPMNLTNVTANDQIQVPSATRMEYTNGQLKFYGPDDENTFEELHVTFQAEGLDPDQIHFENGVLTYACYLKGTHIATPDGETKVEDLKAGDKVLTASGDINTVKWLGFRKLNRSQLPAEHALRASPIRICKDAFADNVPHRDLTVSPGHRFDFDGALVPALSLVNGLTITQDFDVQQFEYYHVELKKFDMLLAEGAAAESYLEVGSNRNSFQNARTVTAHPDFGPAPKNVMLAQYVQKITHEIIEPIRRNLFKRAEILTGARRTADSGLHIMINGQTIHSQTPCKKKGLYRFELHAGIQGDIRILSNAAVVRETSLIDRADTRVIGVGLAGVALITNDQRREIDLDDSALNGFHEAQEIDGIPMRWTLGEAIIPARLLSASKDPVAIELNVLRTHMYWISVEQERAREAV